jgi:hypothetical protein
MSDCGALKRSTLAFRHLLEGYWDDGTWVPGDLELVLRGYGIFRDRAWLDPTRLAHLGDEGLTLRARLEEAIKALISSLSEGEQKSPEAQQHTTALYIREAAYTWCNRLVALRCLEARVAGIDEAIKIKPDYAGRSLRHDRFCRQYPELCQGEDGGLAAFLREICVEAAKELPLLFDPDSPLILLTPSPDALQNCIRALSGETVSLTRNASDRAEGLTDDVFREPDLLGWIYQYWNAEEKDRVFESAARGKKIEGADIIPATCIYTEDYMVRFLVENSLGTLWVEMHPDSKLPEQWQYFVHDVERHPREPRPVTDLTFLDPACGSGHFLVYAFDLLWDMYQEEGGITDPAEICRNILGRNLYGIDIDERSVQLAAISLYLKAKERVPHFTPSRVNLVAANASMPPDAVQRYLKVHPEDKPLHSVLDSIFKGLENVSEVGSLLQIEEQLDLALQKLRKQEAQRAHDGPEQMSMLPLLGLRVPPTQGRLDLDVLPPWEAWKPAVLDRLHQQFQQEADAKDLSTAIFGTEAEKGLDLIELLSRRYDVVAANPPYMGSKNMGQLLKTYVQRHYPQCKRDLYAVFIQRCLQLAEHGGKVAMVTQQSWMFLRSFAELRKSVLEQQTIECLAHLGPRAFEEISGEVVNTALFVLTQAPPALEHRLWAARLIGPKSAEEKATLLDQATQSRMPAVIFCPLQRRFLAIPQVPLCYWLRERFMDLLNTPSIGSVATFTDGVAVRTRFLRFAWEVPEGSRWIPYAKGGQYGRWAGDDRFSYEWEASGVRIKTWVVGRYPADKLTLLIKSHDIDVPWVSWSDVARGSIGCRLVGPGYLIAHTGPAARSAQLPLTTLAAILHSRVATALLRAIAPTLHFTYRDVMRLPVPAETSLRLPKYANQCLAFKRYLVALHPTERIFCYQQPPGTTLREAHRRTTERAEAIAAMLHTLEGHSEREVFAAYGIASEDLQVVLDETGMPAGWFRLIAGYDALPSLAEEIAVDTKLLEPLAREERGMSSPDTVAGLRHRLRALYQAGPGAQAEDESGAGEEDENDKEEQEATISGAHIPIPVETFLEELSQRIEVHPISVYWLLRELREQESVVSLPELCRYVEDYFTVMILRLLGYRWPKQIETNEQVPEWADPDGIIPLTDGTGQSPLLDRVRERIAADFSEARVNAIEQEFRQVMGRSLADWLARDFFPHHISQFKRRPIAWLLESGRAVDTRWETTSGRRGRRPTRSRGSVFACLVYYHKLTADSLTRIKTHYLRPVLQRQEFELAEERRRAAEGNVTARASAERLAEIMDELNAFEAALDTVSTKGFWSQNLIRLLDNEELDHWTRRTPKSPIPDNDAFLRQEQTHDPDLNDGVRVNIAPLQKYGLLATDVLAKKDVDRAIEDRAAWRADERRWCREGKLPKPGWWQDSD